jgi:protein-tyrosine phosphatase
MQPRGLIGLGKDTIDYCGPEIKQVFNVLCDKAAYPVLVHCTQGKDRTGLTVLLTLLLCGVEIETIAKDYMRSEAELESEMEERLKEINSIGLDESFARCPAGFCSQIEDYLETKHGGVQSYLFSIGVTEVQQDAIRNILLL